MIKDLNYYIDCFSSLNTMKKCGKPAPHKALLLLSVIDLVERRIITNCRIPLTDELERQFKHNCTTLLGESILFRPNIYHPYYHLKSEPFWRLISPLGKEVEEICNYSKKNLREHIAYAIIDKELFDLLKDSNVRAKLRVTLISIYLSCQPTLADTIPNILLPLSSISALIA